MEKMGVTVSIHFKIETLWSVYIYTQKNHILFKETKIVLANQNSLWGVSFIMNMQHEVPPRSQVSPNHFSFPHTPFFSPYIQQSQGTRPLNPCIRSCLWISMETGRCRVLYIILLRSIDKMVQKKLKNKRKINHFLQKFSIVSYILEGGKK